MESWAAARSSNRSTPHHYRLPNRLHSLPPSFPLWPCEMTDSSATTSSTNHCKPPTHLEQLRRPSILLPPPIESESSNRNSLPLSQESMSQGLLLMAGTNQESTNLSERRGSGRSERSLKLSPRNIGRRLYPYFDGEDEEGDRERRKETSFFNLGFRHKSTVVYYAANE